MTLLSVLFLLTIATGILAWRFWPRAAEVHEGVRVVDVNGRDIPPSARGEVIKPEIDGETKPASALLREAPDPVRSRHDAIAVGTKDDRLEASTSAVIHSRLGAPASIRFRDVTVSCSQERCEVRGNADGDEVAARLAMREPTFLDALSATGCVTDMDMVSPREAGSEFILYLDCRR